MNYLILILSFFSAKVLVAEDKILSTPLINVEEIAPSFEELEEDNENISNNKNLKEKKMFHL